MRILEVPACGSFLLTDGSSDMKKLITPGEHLVVYNDLEDCVKKAKYYLENEFERNRIANSGCCYVRTNYTYDDIAQSILKTYENLV
ncbi:MAG: glycosyltransferase [bacterium]